MGRPPFSRQQLSWHVFERKETGEWRLVLPTYYAQLFIERRPALMGKSSRGWQDAQSGRHQYAVFNDLSDANVESIRTFVTTYGRLVIIGLNPHIGPYFSDELDACVALDFNMRKQDDGTIVRTEIGEWEYQAKYNQSQEALEHLRREMKRVMPWIPGSRALDPGFKRCVTYVPPQPLKHYHLPRILAQRISATVPVRFPSANESALVDATLTGAKASLKNATFEQKIAEWDRITAQQGVTLSRSVEGYDVYVVDDLYQSGATMWTYARYLKRMGARQVYGMACVKSLRDTDNV